MMRYCIYLQDTADNIFMLAAIMIGRPGRRYVKQERLIEALASTSSIDSLCLRTLPQV